MQAAATHARDIDHIFVSFCHTHIQTHRYTQTHTPADVPCYIPRPMYEREPTPPFYCSKRILLDRGTFPHAGRRASSQVTALERTFLPAPFLPRVIVSLFPAAHTDTHSWARKTSAPSSVPLHISLGSPCPVVLCNTASGFVVSLPRLWNPVNKLLLYPRKSTLRSGSREYASHIA